jgi:hypothetical protein
MNSNDSVSTCIGAIKTNNIHLIEKFVDDQDVMLEVISLSISDILSSKDIYEIMFQAGLEDTIFMNIDYNNIHDIVLDALSVQNFRVLDFAINNASDLNFNINHVIKNRGFMEIALFFNIPQAVVMLLENDVSITKNISTACVNWVTSNYSFIDNYMHTHFKNEEWRADFIEILSILSTTGWLEISQISKKLLATNATDLTKQISNNLKSTTPNINLIIRLINKLDQESIQKISNAITPKKSDWI